jgi:hypothetical protein
LKAFAIFYMPEEDIAKVVEAVMSIVQCGNSEMRRQ